MDGITNPVQPSGDSGSTVNQNHSLQQPIAGENYDIDYSKLIGDSGVPTDPGSSGELQQGEPVEDKLEIDEKFKHLPPEEARYRTIQSRYDKLYNLHQQIVNKQTEYEKVVNLFDNMLEDENLLITFVNQVKPGLIPQRDLKTIIRDRVVKEFGEDYKPTLTRLEAERDDPGGKDWKYYKILDEIEREFSNKGSSAVSTVEEYLKQKQLQKQKEQERLKMEYETVKNKYKATDEEIQAAIQWGNNIDLEKLLIVHRYLRKLPNKAGVSIETQPGQSAVGSTQRETFLKSIFGNNIKI